MCASVFQRGDCNTFASTFHVGFESGGLDLAPSEQDLVQLMGTLWNSVFEGEFDTDAVNLRYGLGSKSEVEIHC